MLIFWQARSFESRTSLLSSHRVCILAQNPLGSSRFRTARSDCAAHAELPCRLIATGPPPKFRYQPVHLDNVEDLEKYRPGGYHPITLGDKFKDDRYHVLHKLGFGGFSTVWLARDKQQNRLVSLKVLTAEASRRPTELKMLRQLEKSLQDNEVRRNLLACLDSFTVDGPNGKHVCYISQLGGPSLSAMSDSSGEIAGTCRIRAPLARKLGRQLASLVSAMHGSGIVHGDITPKNILLQLNGFNELPSSEIYRQIGAPVEAQLFTSTGERPGASAPDNIVEPATLSKIDVQYVSGRLLLTDLGEAFSAPSPPAGLGTPMSYCSPELITERKASKASDVWALACTIFEMRAGFPLFESFVGSSTEILREMVRILGPPPDISHSVWTKINLKDSFETSSLEERIQEIGMYDYETSRANDDRESSNQYSLLEPLGRRVSEEEIRDLADLIRRALEYSPEKRLLAKQVAHHSWLVGGG